MTVTKELPTPMPDFTLTANDRCDACGARAYHQVWITVSYELKFCGHHGKEKRALIGDVFDWLDESAAILHQP